MVLLWQILTHFRLDNTLKYFPLSNENIHFSTSRGCVWQIGSKMAVPMVIIVALLLIVSSRDNK